MKDVLTLLTKSVLVLLGLTATAAAAASAGIQKKKILRSKASGSGTTKLIILNEEMRGIMEIFKSLEDSGLLKVVTQTTENETWLQRGGFLAMVLGTLGAG